MKKAFIYISVTIISWSTVASAFKIALRHLSFYELLFIASFTAFIFFLVAMSIGNKWHNLKSLTKKDWLISILSGFLNPAAYYLILFKSYELLPAQIAQPINYTWPLVLSVFIAFFSRQRIPAIKFIGMFISFAGVVLISFGPKQLSGISFSLPGILLAFFSAFVWATYWLINNMRRKLDSVTGMFLNFLFGCFWLLLIAPFMDINFASFDGVLTGILNSEFTGNVAGVLAGVYSGLFEMAIPFILFGMALKTTQNPVLINHLCFLSPFLSLFLINIILGESIYPSTYIGLSLIISGILFNEYFKINASKKRLSNNYN